MRRRRRGGGGTHWAWFRYTRSVCILYLVIVGSVLLSVSSMVNSGCYPGHCYTTPAGAYMPSVIRYYYIII